jgi:hypothetical protein
MKWIEYYLLAMNEVTWFRIRNAEWLQQYASFLFQAWAGTVTGNEIRCVERMTGGEHKTLGH